jgi:LPS sulfotransferase NodH
LFKGGLFIHLYREDVLKQAISERFAQLTGRWGIDDTVTTAPTTDPDFYDLDAIARTIEDLEFQDRGWKSFFARNNVAPLSISYEKLCENPFGFVELIAQRLKMDPRTLRPYNEPASPYASDPLHPDKAEVARLYLASSQTRIVRAGSPI